MTPDLGCAMALETVVEIRDLTKRFGRNTAVSGLDLSVRSGDVFGFLGPNGAGKTTTIRCLLGLVKPTSGSVRILGRDASARSADALAPVGSLVERPAFYPYLTGRANLSLFARLSGRGGALDASAAIELVRLGEAADRRFGTYSQGMRQLLGIALALLGTPRLVVLDEPTSGLDPEAARTFRDLVGHLASECGVTVFLSSHLLHEIEATCNRVAILNEGRLVVEGSVQELLRPERGEVRIRVSSPPAALDCLRSSGLVTDGRVIDAEIRVRARSEDLSSVNERLVMSGFRVSELTPVHPSLEDLFLERTTKNGKRSPGG